MKKKVETLLFALLVAAAFALGFAVPAGAGSSCWTTCCDGGSPCISCCKGQACPDLICP